MSVYQSTGSIVSAALPTRDLFSTLNKTHLTTSGRIAHKVFLAEHCSGILGTVPLPHPMHLPQILTMSWAILAPGLSTLRVKKLFTRALCRHGKGPRPAIYGSWMARTKEE